MPTFYDKHSYSLKYPRDFQSLLILKAYVTKLQVVYCRLVLRSKQHRWRTSGRENTCQLHHRFRKKRVQISYKHLFWTVCERESQVHLLHHFDFPIALLSALGKCVSSYRGYTVRHMTEINDNIQQLCHPHVPSRPYFAICISLKMM